MIRQLAFSTDKKLLKGALHCHTTRSDGRGTPQDVIRQHADNGYDFMAITDHRLYNFKNYAPEIPMTIIPGMEFDGNYPVPGVHCYHIVSIGPKEGENGFTQDQSFESAKVTSQEEFQPYLDMLHEANNMTIYCHPVWSGTPAREFENLRGNFAMEIWNTGCAEENDMDTNAAYWDEILMQGKRILGVATDDGHPVSQHCKGWVRVNAQNNLESILEALKAGAFYASCGPEILDFYIDDESVAHVKCSSAKSVQFIYGGHPTMTTQGEDVTEASFSVPSYFKYMRVCVVDKNGKRAWSNPIFLKDE